MTIITKASLADELNISRARVTQYCQRGMPVRSDGKLDRETCLNWVKENIDATQRHDRGAAVAEVLAGRFQPQPSARPAEPNRAGPPAGYEAVKLAGTELHAGALTMGLAMVYGAGVLAADAAVAAKLPLRSAFRFSAIMTFAVMERFADFARDAGIEPFASTDEPAVYDPDAFAEPDWHALAVRSGEAVDRAVIEECRENWRRVCGR